MMASGSTKEVGSLKEQYESYLDKLNLHLEGRAKSGHSNAVARDLIDSWQEDLYKDFESVYESMCERASGHGDNNRSDGDNNNNKWNERNKNNTTNPVDRESRLMAESMADVEEALERISTADLEQTDGNSPYLTISEKVGSNQVSPCTSSVYGERLALAGQHLEVPSPMLSVAASEQTRADSRNTNQSFQMGPALVEEMTLSDLEDEISSSLMASRESDSFRRKYFCETESQMLKMSRNRQPLPVSLSCHTNTRTLQTRPASYQGQMEEVLSGYYSDQSHLKEGTYARMGGSNRAHGAQ